MWGQVGFSRVSGLTPLSYTLKTQGPEKERNLPKITEPAISRTEVRIQGKGDFQFFSGALGIPPKRPGDHEDTEWGYSRLASTRGSLLFIFFIKLNILSMILFEETILLLKIPGKHCTHHSIVCITGVIICSCFAHQKSRHIQQGKKKEVKAHFCVFLRDRTVHQMTYY